MQNDLTLTQMQQLVQNFIRQRDWQQYHSPQNVARYLLIEAGELAELFVWIDSEEAIKDRIEEVAEKVSHEVADIMYCLADLCSIMGLSFYDIVLELTNTTENPVDEPTMGQLQQALAAEYLRVHGQLPIKQIIDQLVIGCADLLVNTLSGAYKDDEGKIVLQMKDLLFKLLFLDLIVAEICRIHAGVAFIDKLVHNELKYPAETVKGNFRKYTEQK